MDVQKSQITTNSYWKKALVHTAETTLTICHTGAAQSYATVKLQLMEKLQSKTET